MLVPSSCQQVRSVIVDPLSRQTDTSIEAMDSSGQVYSADGVISAGDIRSY